MEIRPYQGGDAEETARLFFETVHRVCGGDYTAAQRLAWAPVERDMEQWNRSFAGHDALVAVEADRIVGFGDLWPGGYLDRLYVHWARQRQGIASALCAILEWNCAAPVLTVHASRTARPFFESRGYRIVRPQQVERFGVTMENFVMEKIR